MAMRSGAQRALSEINARPDITEKMLLEHGPGWAHNAALAAMTPRGLTEATDVAEDRLCLRTGLPRHVARVVAKRYVQTQAFYEEYLSANDYGTAKRWGFNIPLPAAADNSAGPCEVGISLVQGEGEDPAEGGALWYIEFTDTCSWTAADPGLVEHARRLLATGTVTLDNDDIYAPDDYESPAVFDGHGSIDYFGNYVPAADAAADAESPPARGSEPAQWWQPPSSRATGGAVPPAAVAQRARGRRPRRRAPSRRPSHASKSLS